MKRLVFNRPVLMADWLGKRLGGSFKSAYAMGMVEDGHIIAVVAYNQFHWPAITMHVAAEPGKLWATREFRFHAFSYPFIQLNCRRVTALVAAKNVVSQRFEENLGFTLEGRMERALPDDDQLIYRMFKEDCKWIRPEFALRAAA